MQTESPLRHWSVRRDFGAAVQANRRLHNASTDSARNDFRALIDGEREHLKGRSTLGDKINPTPDMIESAAGGGCGWIFVPIGILGFIAYIAMGQASAVSEIVAPPAHAVACWAQVNDLGISDAPPNLDTFCFREDGTGTHETRRLMGGSTVQRICKTDIYVNTVSDSESRMTVRYDKESSSRACGSREWKVIFSGDSLYLDRGFGIEEFGQYQRASR